MCFYLFWANVLFGPRSSGSKGSYEGSTVNRSFYQYISKYFFKNGLYDLSKLLHEVTYTVLTNEAEFS